MTVRGKQIGLKNSTFKNSNGWPADGHNMSVRDLGILAEKLITDADELRLLLDGQKEGLEIFRGWRNEIFGKFVIPLLNGKIAFTIKDNKIKKIEI